MMRPGLWALGLLLGLAVCLGGARAHEISMAELEIRQASPTDFVWQWTAGNRTGESVLRPVWPDGCHDDAGVLRCGSAGLAGTLGMEGVGRRFSAVLVRVHWADGQSRVHTLTQAQPTVQLFGGADDRRALAEVAWAYTVLGFEHILVGADHLAFVAALLFLVGFGRHLLWTVTAFTVAHSVTLALSALGWVVLRPPPVEAAIALSIVLVAREALTSADTWTRRWPALVAFLFGLVHGLGFAGALQQIGLPQHHVPAALLSFNVGVELGQLVFIGAAWVTWRAARAMGESTHRLRAPALYALGAGAAFWSWGRVLALVG